jgi:hypothetical protein
MHPIIRGNFIDRPFPTERFQDHFRFELPTLLPPLSGHQFLLPEALTHLTYSVVHFLGYIIFYERLRATGKAAKVALTACMRKLLTILNAMVQHHTPWQVQEVPNA